MQRAVDAQPRAQLVRLEHLVGIGVDAGPELRHPRRFHGQPGGLLVPAEADEQIGAPLERAEHVEVGDAAARAMRHVPFDRQHDRRLVVGVHQLRRGDADHAAVPAQRRRPRARCGRRPRDRSRWPSWPARPAPLLPADGGGSRRSTAAPAPRASPSIASPAASSRRVAMSGRAHAARGVDARGDHERDLIAVDGLAGRARSPRAARAARSMCGPRLSEARPRRAITRFSPTSGTTSASVPIAAILTNAGSHFALPGPCAQRLHQLQRDADPGEMLVRIGAVVAFRVDHRIAPIGSVVSGS